MANILPLEKKIMAIHMLCEGSSIRAIERMTGVHRDTIMRLGVRVGEGCRKLMDEKMRNLNCPDIQVDEVWGFIGAKAKTVKIKKLSAEYGDVWSWIAIDSKTKLVPCFAVGDRSKYMANCFMEDLASRVNGRVQITSDALKCYVDAVERAFGSEVDYGTVVKEFRHTDLDSPNTRYSPPDVLKVKKTAVQGNPERSRISTSFVETPFSSMEYPYSNHTINVGSMVASWSHYRVDTLILWGFNALRYAPWSPRKNSSLYLRRRFP